MSFMELNNVIIALLLTLGAGLSTGIGSALAFFTRKTNRKMLSMALGFSAGVMIYVSFMEILPEAQKNIHEAGYKQSAAWWALGAFLLGIILIGLIDYLIPEFENPHEISLVEDLNDAQLKEQYEQKSAQPVPAEGPKDRNLWRMGLFSALAIAIHNFPEGIATFASALQNLDVGIPIAIAIALHNIPEGIAVAIPLYFATGSRKKAFTLSFLSGLAEPLGALLGFFVLLQFFNGFILGMLLASVAGIMVFISLDELLPAAQKYGEHHISIYSLVAGMLVMGMSLNML